MFGFDMTQIADMIPKVQKAADEVMVQFKGLKLTQDSQQEILIKVMRSLEEIQEQQKTILEKLEKRSEHV